MYLHIPAIPKLYAGCINGREKGGALYSSNSECHSVKLLSPKKYSVSEIQMHTHYEIIMHAQWGKLVESADLVCVQRMREN